MLYTHFWGCTYMTHSCTHEDTPAPKPRSRSHTALHAHIRTSRFERVHRCTQSHPPMQMCVCTQLTTQGPGKGHSNTHGTHRVSTPSFEHLYESHTHVVTSLHRTHTHMRAVHACGHLHTHIQTPVQICAHTAVPRIDTQHARCLAHTPTHAGKIHIVSYY